MTSKSPATRSFQTAFHSDLLPSYQAGTLKYTYKGVRCIKSPIDMALYMHLIWHLRPRTIIEIGSKEGGSALWFADMITAYGLDCPIYSIDLQLPELIVDTRINFLTGDVHNLDATVSAIPIDHQHRPLLVIEDSAHTYDGCMAALRTFADVMQTGDVLVMEDGVLDDLGLSENYQGGPNRAIAQYLSENSGQFSIMEEYCDYFGPNATYNPNGYLIKN